MAQRVFAVACVVVAWASFAGIPPAQNIVVDGETITAHDIDQRISFDQLATHKMPSRAQAIDELRRETLALHEARLLDIEVSDVAVERAYANMAARMHLTPMQLTAALAIQGIEAATLKRRIRADIAHMKLLRSRMRGQDLPSRTIEPPLRDGPFRMIDPPLRDRHRPPDPLWCADCLELGAAGARPHL